MEVMITTTGTVVGLVDQLNWNIFHFVAWNNLIYFLDRKNVLV